MRIEICVQSFPTCNVLTMLISHSSVSCNKKHCFSSTTQFHRLTYNKLKYSKDGRLHLKMKLMPKTLSWGVSLYLLLVRAFSLCNEWDSFDSFSTLVGITYLFYQTCVLINSTFFQICRFCWNKIRTEGSGLCPACRSPYAENPADFKPLTVEELAKIKEEKRKKDQVRGKHNKEIDSLGIQKHLMFSSNWIDQWVISSNMKCLKSEIYLPGNFVFCNPLERDTCYYRD